MSNACSPNPDDDPPADRASGVKAGVTVRSTSDIADHLFASSVRSRTAIPSKPRRLRVARPCPDLDPGGVVGERAGGVTTTSGPSTNLRATMRGRALRTRRVGAAIDREGRLDVGAQGLETRRLRSGPSAGAAPEAHFGCGPRPTCASTIGTPRAGSLLSLMSPVASNGGRFGDRPTTTASTTEDRSSSYGAEIDTDHRPRLTASPWTNPVEPYCRTSPTPREGEPPPPEWGRGCHRAAPGLGRSLTPPGRRAPRADGGRARTRSSRRPRPAPFR